MNATDRLLREALETIASSEEAKLPLRLLGGLAVGVRCPSFSEKAFLRDCGDMDFAAMGPAKPLETFLESRGFSPDRQFNMYNGDHRLLFRSPLGNKVDIFVTEFSMCHRLPFAGRLTCDRLTLPLAELLVTKLQICEANAKDLSDTACLLADHAFGHGDGESINAGRIAQLCGADWGLYHTLKNSTTRLGAWVSSGLEGAGAVAGLVAVRVAELDRIIESCPRTAKWKLRSAIGEKLPWYKTVEEVER